jgi:hypothetical protein
MEQTQLPKTLTPCERLIRMRKSFERNKSVLAEDYQYFSTLEASLMPRAPIHRNKVARMSVGQCERRSQEQSEMPSSDKTGD